MDLVQSAQSLRTSRPLSDPGGVNASSLPSLRPLVCVQIEKSTSDPHIGQVMSFYLHSKQTDRFLFSSQSRGLAALKINR